jgi:hypothetical protein
MYARRLNTHAPGIRNGQYVSSAPRSRQDYYAALESKLK